MEALNPVQRRGGIGQFADAIVESTLAAANAPEVETQHGKAALHESLVESLRDAVVHRAATLRMGMQDHRDRCAGTGRRAETAFEAAFGSGENNVGHGTCYGSGRHPDKGGRRLDAGARKPVLALRGRPPI